MKYIKYIPSMVLPILLTSLIVFSLGNILSVKEYGEYNLVITTVSILSSTIFAITNSSLIRFYPLYINEESDNSYLSTLYSMQLLISVLLIIVLSVFDVHLVYIIGVLAVPFLNFIFGYYRTTGKAFLFFMFKVIPYIMILILIWIFIFFEKNINHNIALFIFYSPILLASFIWISYKIVKKEVIFSNWNQKYAIEALSFGKSLVIINLLHSGIAHLDKYVLKFYGYKEFLGAYSFAYRLTEIIFVNVAVLMVLVFYPNLIKEYEKNNWDLSSKILSKELNNFLIISMVILFYFFVNIEYLISYFFSQYLNYLNLFYIVSISGFLFGVTYFTNKYFELSKKVFNLGKLLVTSLVINFILNIVLIPFFTGYGAAISSIVTYLLVIYLSLSKSKEQLNIKIKFRDIYATLMIMFLSVVSGNLTYMFLSNFIGFESTLMKIVIINVSLTISLVFFVYRYISLRSE